MSQMPPVKAQCAPGGNLPLGLTVMEEVNVESAVVYTASEYGTVRSDTNRAAAIFFFLR